MTATIPSMVKVAHEPGVNGGERLNLPDFARESKRGGVAGYWSIVWRPSCSEAVRRPEHLTRAVDWYCLIRASMKFLSHASVREIVYRVEMREAEEGPGAHLVGSHWSVTERCPLRR